MYRDGLSMRDIAKRTGVSAWTIHDRLHRLGVQIREEGGSENGRKGKAIQMQRATK